VLHKACLIACLGEAQTDIEQGEDEWDGGFGDGWRTPDGSQDEHSADVDGASPGWSLPSFFSV
jgi:hypothetical protein